MSALHVTILAGLPLCVENLKKSLGDSKIVREVSGKMEKVKEFFPPEKIV